MLQPKRKSNLLLALFLTLFITAPVIHVDAASNNTKLQSGLEEALICLCGCGQTVKNCPHENCGFAIPARTQVTALINEGKSKEEIMQIFLDKYGDEIFAAPRKEGFNLVGYIMPFAILLAAAGVLLFIVKSWAAKGMRDEEKTAPKAAADAGSKLDKQIEKELEELD